MNFSTSGNGQQRRFLAQGIQDLGMKVLGVDPAKTIAIATVEDVTTMADFFSSAIARTIRAEHGPAQLICVNNLVST